MKLQSWAKTLSLPLVGVVRLRFVFFTLARYRGRRTWATPAAFFPRLSEQQISLELDAGYTTAPAVVLELRDEIAAAWSLPLGQRVEVCFRGGPADAGGRPETRRDWLDLFHATMGTGYHSAADKLAALIADAEGK